MGLAMTIAMTFTGATPADAQRPTVAQSDQMLPPQSGPAAYHKWAHGAPIKIFVVTAKQSASCVQIALDQIRDEAAQIRTLIPQLQNIRDPELIDWIPHTRIDAPLLIGLQMVPGQIVEAMQWFGKFNKPRAKFEHVEKNFTTSFGREWGLERNEIVMSYSWTIGPGGLAQYSDHICRDSNGYRLSLLDLLGGQGFGAHRSDWMSNASQKGVPFGRLQFLATLMHRLFLMALYDCPDSPSDRECVRRRLNALIANATNFPEQ